MTSTAQSSFLVTGLTVLGLGFSFLSNLVMAAYFGAGTDMDVFFTATAVPAFVLSIVSCCLNFVFVPLFTEYRHRIPNALPAVAIRLILLISLLGLFLTIAVLLGGSWIIRVIAPGFSELKRNSAVELLVWLSPTIFLGGINETMAASYYSSRRFLLPSTNKLIGPTLTILFVLLLGRSISTRSLVVAIVISACIQTCLLLIPFLKEYISDRAVHDSQEKRVFSKEVRRAIRLMIPLLLGMVFYKSSPIIDRVFLSQFQEGAISHVSYAFKLVSLLIQVLPAGITITLFPLFSHHGANGDFGGMVSLLGRGIRVLFFITLPFVGIMLFFGESIIRILFQRGAFIQQDSVGVYHAFAIYLFSLPAMVSGSLVGQGFYSIKETRIPAIMGVLEISVYVLLCNLLIPIFGWYAIPLSHSIYLNISFLVTCYVFSRIVKRPLISQIAKPALFYSILAIISGGIFYCIRSLTPFTNTGIEIVFVCAAFITYFLLERMLINSEAGETLRGSLSAISGTVLEKVRGLTKQLRRLN